MGESLVDSGDVRGVVAHAVAALRTVADQDWQVPAGDLEWACWETVEHVADDLFAYAGQLAAEQPPTDQYVPWGHRRSRPGAPALTVYTDPEHGTAGLLHLLDAAQTLNFARSPDPDVVARVLRRLFPDVPAGNDPWPTLLWATGRAELPGHPRRTEWRWHAE